MAKRATSKTSKILRERLLAYSRRHRTGSEGGDDKPRDGSELPDDRTPDADARPDAANNPDASPRASDESGAAATEAAPGAAISAPTAPTHERSRADTMLMSPEISVGLPPEVPASTAAATTVEERAFMPGPRDIPPGNPEDPASPPGHVPPGDSRSLRRGNEFALVYRVTTSVISRFGVIGTRGQWRVVEYPTLSSASNSYAKECSRFVSEGFSDYRG